MNLKRFFGRRKRKFCQECGKKLVIWHKLGNPPWSTERWKMLSCPSLEGNSSVTVHSGYNEHYSTILAVKPIEPLYDIYTGRRLDGNTDSSRW